MRIGEREREMHALPERGGAMAWSRGSDRRPRLWSAHFFLGNCCYSFKSIIFICFRIGHLYNTNIKAGSEFWNNVDQTFRPNKFRNNRLIKMKERSGSVMTVFVGSRSKRDTDFCSHVLSLLRYDHAL